MHAKLLQLCPTLCAPLGYSQPNVSVRGLGQEYGSGLPSPPPGDVPKPEIKPASPTSPALAGGFFTTSATWEASLTHIYDCISSLTFSSVQSLSHVPLFATPWTAACKASLSTTNSWSLLKRMSIESAMPSNHLSLCHPLLLPPSIFTCIRVF